MSHRDDWPQEAKNEISRLEQENDRLELENDRLELENDRLELENDRLELENDALQQEVGRSVAKIISLQGEGEQITDGDLRKGFEEICANIEDWAMAIEVEFLQQGRDFRQVFNQVLEDDSGQRLLYQWGLLEKPQGLLEEIRKLHWLGKLDTCINIVLPRVIWQFLYDGIFAKTYAPGIQDEPASGLHCLIEAIRHGADGRLTEGQLQAGESIT